MAKLSKKAKLRIWNAAIVVLSLTLAVSTGVLIWYGFQSKQSEELYTDLQSIVDAARPAVPIPIPTEPADPQEPTEPAISQDSTIPEDTQPEETQPEETQPTETEPAFPLVDVVDPETGMTVKVLPEYAQLYQMNNDLVGWLEIEGSDIRYPVMQTPDNPDYYLRRSFNKEYSVSGCLYAEEAADVFEPSDNVTIYGHRMGDGSMFYQLLRYADKKYYLQYPYIRFDSLTERHVYQIVFAFRTTATVGKGFSYNSFVNAKNEYQFYDFVDECRSLAIYDTGVKVAYGDKLITLSTCEYSQENGRFVVVAKRVG